ncbi:unnamed protein product [Mycena citricolor]|uniref:APC amino acid permease n=1 Tax=Mycena citricolor TaxID=2018698 RepID=A0AAD2HGB4_9AGAR|nr:unnamed protein product [Mycena citricolor]
MSSLKNGVHSSVDDDDKELLAMGYVPSFKREFSNLATISFAFSIMGLCSSIATTLNTPLLLGGPSTVVWCWILGATMCFTLGSSIAEIVSAFPTCGGLYTASAQLTPVKYRAIVGWVVGWLNILGQIAGVSSTEFGLSGMILGAAVIGQDGAFVVTPGKTVGVFVGLLILHGLLNSVGTRHLARFTQYFVFVNLGATMRKSPVFELTASVSSLTDSDHHCAACDHSAKRNASGVVRVWLGRASQCHRWLEQRTGVPVWFAFGAVDCAYHCCIARFSLNSLLQMTDYDATAHISEEVRRAAYAAPAAIFIAGASRRNRSSWLAAKHRSRAVFCKQCTASRSLWLGIPPDHDSEDGQDGSSHLWVLVCLTAFFVVQTALQAVSRTVFAFSRDHGLPDRGYFGHNSRLTQTPLRSIWLCTLFSILPGLLDLASPAAANAIFSLTAIALDLSYIIPIGLRRVFQNHPDVLFKPGPFYMGPGFLGWFANIACITWTLFVCVVFSFPTLKPVTPLNMNYASVITVGVMALSLFWYVVHAHRHYKGPTSNIGEAAEDSEFYEKEKKGQMA